MQFLVKGDLENFQRPQIALAIYYGLVKYLVFDRITRFLTPNFTRNHVSSNLCCYLQVVPCHLRARFHIRFKRHARRMDQVRHFSTKICVLKTRAKPVTFLVCCKRAMYLYEKTTIRPIGSLYFPEFFDSRSLLERTPFKTIIQDLNLT